MVFYSTLKHPQAKALKKRYTITYTRQYLDPYSFLEIFKNFPILTKLYIKYCTALQEPVFKIADPYISALV